MASTNKTTHYELSQYIGTDKPTYLVDYNNDMDKIDTGIYNAKYKADTNETNIGDITSLSTTDKSSLVGAINEINTNETNNATHIGTLTSLNTTEKSNLVGAINEVKTEADENKTNIGTLVNLNTTEKSSLVGAINEVKTEANTNKANIENFNLTDFKTIDSNDFVPTNGTLPSTKDIKIAKNSDGSLAKIYGNIRFDSTNTGNNTILIKNSGLTPTQDIIINNAGILRIENYQFSPASFDIKIKTNGDIETLDRTIPSGYVGVFMFLPMLYFIKDFGDVPTPQN